MRVPHRTLYAKRCDDRTALHRGVGTGAEFLRSKIGDRECVPLFVGKPVVSVGEVTDDVRKELRDLTEAARFEAENMVRSGVAESVSPVPAPEEASITVATPEIAPATRSLDDIRTELGDCTRCGLHKERNQLVFGVGNPNADLVFVGEAPGRDEDRQGEPFVGRAGKLLTDIIEAIGFSRKEVYICNVIKCRPPNNRNPEPIEVATCEPYLRAQIDSIRPQVLCALGKFAAQTLLGVETPISRLRGQFYEYNGVPLMPTYHPAYLLRNSAGKKHVWEDMKLVHAELCRRTGRDIPRKGK